MAQRVKRIALDRSYLPIDPNTLPQTMHDTGGEDRPEERIPVIPFEGWNFMPTGYGWRSYFGLSSALGINALPSPLTCRDAFTFQKTNLTHIIIALCDDGIYTKAGESAGAWTKEIALTAPASGVLREWSRVILENVLYVYRQGEASAYKMESPGFTFVAHTPNTLNMEGQLGIFKAGNRLGFWDSADSIGVSALHDFADFVPSISTMANIFTIKDKIGKIINILQHGEGWIVYATKSIIAVRRDPGNSFLWKATPISNVAGIAYRNQACTGAPDNEHFAWTSIGLMRIRDFAAEIITPELYDFLKESQSPVYLRMLEGRYLAVQLADAAYVNGLLSFYTETIEGITVTLAEANTIWAAIPDYTLVTSMDEADASVVYALFNSQPAQTSVESEEGGCSGIGYCTGKDYGVYEDVFVCPITPVTALAETLKSGQFATFDSAPLVFNGQIVNLGTLAQPIGDLETFIETVSSVVKDYAGSITITEPNEQNFYDKTTAIWNKYNQYLDGYVLVLKNKLNSMSPKFLTTGIHADVVPLIVVDPEETTFGVILGNFAGVLHGATSVYLTPEAGADEYIGRLPYSYELEYGKSGYTFYSIAKPTKVLTYEGDITANNAYLGTFTMGSAAWDGAASDAGFSGFPGGFVSGATFTDVYNAALINLATFDLTVTGVGSTLVSPFYRYIDVNNQFAASLSSEALTLKTEAGADWTPTTEGMQAVLNVTHAVYGAGTVTITAQASSIKRSYDLDITFADVVNPAVYCAREQFISYTHPTSFIRYSLDGAVLSSPNTPPAYSEAAVLAASLCGEGLEARPRPSLYGMTIPAPASFIPRIEVVVGSVQFLISDTEAITFTFPDVSFLLQEGTAAPYSITWKGAYVYDTHLQRWGKLKADYQQLLDFSPLNSVAVGIIPYTNFGIQGALLDNDGVVRVFDAQPTDSYLKFGKYGNFRQGFTALENVRADFRQPSAGQIEVEPSFDGKTVDSANVRTYNYNNVIQASFGLGGTDAISAKWFNIAFRGRFDLSYLELTSWSASRR